MRFELKRIAENKKSTAGLVLAEDGTVICAMLERAKDDSEHPRIPAGTYRLIQRPIGSSRFDADYQKERPDIYRGMFMIEGVPGRTYIELHKGNWYFQTDGCVLLGKSTKFNLAQQYWEIPPGESGPGFWVAYAALSAALPDIVVEVLDPAAAVAAEVA